MVLYKVSFTCLYINSVNENIPRDINDDDLENDIREAFRCFDKDALGYISVPSKAIIITALFIKSKVDLTNILENLGEKLSAVETREMMVMADEDGDGNINYEEFISMLFKVIIMMMIMMTIVSNNTVETWTEDRPQE